MTSAEPALHRTSSLQQGIQKSYKFNELLQNLQLLLFSDLQKNNNTPIDSPFSSSPINSSDHKQYFYKNEQPISIIQKQVQKALGDVKKIVGKAVFDHLDLIKKQISQNPTTISPTYLKYLYGVLKIYSIEQNYLTRILIWIYSLCYGNYQKQSQLLKKIIHDHSKTLVVLGLNILATQNNKIRQKLQNQHLSCVRRNERRFKKAMAQFIKSQQHKNHQQAYQICRICESHISVNLMHAHLVLCETVFEKKYLQIKIQQIGKQLFQKIKLQPVEYDFLDSRADNKLFFNRVFTTLGEKAVVFQIKEDDRELDQVIQQFRDNSNSDIRKAVELLQQYYQNITTKADAAGYDSDQGIRTSNKSNKSKLKSSKLVSKNSLKFSSKSISPFANDSDSRNSSTGSQKNIRFCQQVFIKSSQTFYTLDDFSILKLLGKGAYSQVYLVKNLNTNDFFAMKVVQVENIDTETLDALKKEQQIYKKISSQFAIKLFYSFSQENLHFFLLEYANGGNLRHLLEEECYLQEEYAKVYIANLILAIEELHEMKVIHRDLKPENIVIDEEGFLKLTDFNLAFMLTAYQEQKDQSSEKFFGSPDYISPQVIKLQLKDHPSRDIWSLGVIAYQILIGVTPFTGMQVQQVFQNVLNGQIQWPQIGSQQGMISQQAKDLIQCLLQPDPYKRLGFNGISQLKSHRFFKNVNWVNIRQHRPFFVPKRQSLNLKQNKFLKEKINDRKTSKSTFNMPSLGCIIRYDVLKSKSSLKAKSARKSRFKMQKQLNELKILTSMDSFPVSTHTPSSQVQVRSTSSQSAFNSSQSDRTIQLNNVSYHSIKAVNSHKAVIHQQTQEEYDIKIISPNKEIIS